MSYRLFSGLAQHGYLSGRLISGVVKKALGCEQVNNGAKALLTNITRKTAWVD